MERRLQRQVRGFIREPGVCSTQPSPLPLERLRLASSFDLCPPPRGDNKAVASVLEAVGHHLQAERERETRCKFKAWADR